MGKKKRLQKPRWLDVAAIIIAMLALGFSVYEYKADRPHTAFEETCARLDLLDERIDLAESYIRLWAGDPNPGVDVVGCQDNLTQARSLRGQASSSLLRYECERSQEYILQADDLVASVPPYPATTSVPLYRYGLGVVIGLALCGGVILLYWLLTLRKGASSDSEDDQGPRIP